MRLLLLRSMIIHLLAHGKRFLQAEVANYLGKGFIDVRMPSLLIAILPGGRHSIIKCLTRLILSQCTGGSREPFNIGVELAHAIEECLNQKFTRLVRVAQLLNQVVAIFGSRMDCNKFLDSAVKIICCFFCLVSRSIGNDLRPNGSKDGRQSAWKHLIHGRPFMSTDSNNRHNFGFCQETMWENMLQFKVFEHWYMDFILGIVYRPLDSFVVSIVFVIRLEWEDNSVVHCR